MPLLSGYDPLTADLREIVDACLSLEKTGCPWRYLPTDFGPWVRRAESVRVMQIADHTDRSELDDVVAFLALHDVKASAILSKPSGWTVADDLQKTARDVGADLIVTGAYGYSRLREWFFGGVTHDLLVGASVCCLMSH